MKFLKSSSFVFQHELLLILWWISFFPFEQLYELTNIWMLIQLPSFPLSHWYSDSTIQWFHIALRLQHLHGDRSLPMITPAVSQSPPYLTISLKAELCCSFNYIHSFAILNPGLTYLHWSSKYTLKRIMKKPLNSSNYYSPRLIEVPLKKPCWINTF